MLEVYAKNKNHTEIRQKLYSNGVSDQETSQDFIIKLYIYLVLNEYKDQVKEID